LSVCGCAPANARRAHARRGRESTRAVRRRQRSGPPSMYRTRGGQGEALGQEFRRRRAKPRGRAWRTRALGDHVSTPNRTAFVHVLHRGRERPSRPGQRECHGADSSRAPAEWPPGIAVGRLPACPDAFSLGVPGAPPSISWLRVTSHFKVACLLHSIQVT